MKIKNKIEGRTHHWASKINSERWWRERLILGWQSSKLDDRQGALFFLLGLLTFHLLITRDKWRCTTENKGKEEKKSRVAIRTGKAMRTGATVSSLRLPPPCASYSLVFFILDPIIFVRTVQILPEGKPQRTLKEGGRLFLVLSRKKRDDNLRVGETLTNEWLGDFRQVGATAKLRNFDCKLNHENKSTDSPLK